MKETELMIGDWVLFNGEEHQIQEVLFESVTVQCWPQSLDSIKPIHITSKILEQNGFMLNGNIYVLQTSNRYYPRMIFVEYVTSNNCLFINDVMIPKPILYIHELQRALRLCGVDMEIKIMK